jgi:hypothetical protein
MRVRKYCGRNDVFARVFLNLTAKTSKKWRFADHLKNFKLMKNLILFFVTLISVGFAFGQHHGSLKSEYKKLYPATQDGINQAVVDYKVNIEALFNLDKTRFWSPSNTIGALKDAWNASCASEGKKATTAAELKNILLNKSGNALVEIRVLDRNTTYTLSAIYSDFSGFGYIETRQAKGSGNMYEMGVFSTETGELICSVWCLNGNKNSCDMGDGTPSIHNTKKVYNTTVINDTVYNITTINETVVNRNVVNQTVQQPQFIQQQQFIQQPMFQAQCFPQQPFFQQQQPCFGCNQPVINCAPVQPIQVVNNTPVIVHVGGNTIINNNNVVVPAPVVNPPAPVWDGPNGNSGNTGTWDGPNGNSTTGNGTWDGQNGNGNTVTYDDVNPWYTPGPGVKPVPTGNSNTGNTGNSGSGNNSGNTGGSGNGGTWDAGTGGQKPAPTATTVNTNFTQPTTTNTGRAFDNISYTAPSSTSTTYRTVNNVPVSTPSNVTYPTVSNGKVVAPSAPVVTNNYSNPTSSNTYRAPNNYGVSHNYIQPVTNTYNAPSNYSAPTNYQMPVNNTYRAPTNYVAPQTNTYSAPAGGYKAPTAGGTVFYGR